MEERFNPLFGRAVKEFLEGVRVLFLSRKIGESIEIGGGIRVTVT